MARRVAVAIATFALVGCAFAQSNPPSPTPPKGSQQQEAQAAKSDEISKDDKGATSNSAPIMYLFPSPNADDVAKRKEEREEEKSTYDRLIAYSTVALAVITFFLALYTAKLWRATVNLGRDAKETADRQAKEMQDSLAIARDNAEAAKKSAKAAENTADIMVATAQAELRPYLTVTIGGGAYQDRASNIKFAVHPWLFNSGRSPAHKMRYWARAAILPFPLPQDFDFPLPDNINESAHVIGPSQGIELDAHVDDFVPDEEVNEIKRGLTRRVHIWGVVTYDDSFSNWQTTNFCHSIFWWGPPNAERIGGHYSFQHNEAT